VSFSGYSMETAAADTTNVVSCTTDNPAVSEKLESTPKVEEKKLTKAEKKLKYGQGGEMGEEVNIWRDLLKGLLAPADKAPRDPEEEKEANELAESALFEIFGGADNPYRAVFDIYTVFADREKYKRLHKFLFNKFEVWIDKCSTPEKRDQWLTNDFKIETMEKIVKKGTGQLENLLRIFHLKEADVTDLVTQKIQELCNVQTRQQFGEAMKLAHHFDLHEKFNIEMFLIPQLLKNKQDDVEKFVKGHHGVTRALIRFLDDMVEQTDNYKMSVLQPYVDRKILTSEIAYQFINGKKIPNMLKKLVSSDFGMDESAAPNYESKKTKDKLRYLLFDRDSTDGSFTTTIFDHVKTHIKKGSRMSRDVIIALFDRIDKREKTEDKQTYYDEAEMWMLFYELQPSQFFGNIKAHFTNTPGWRERATQMLAKYDTGDASSSDNNTLSDGTPIHWIDKWEEVEGMLYDIAYLGKDGIIGIDSEFRSTTNNKQEIALLQISSINRVYLVDFERLHNLLSTTQWTSFTSRLFGGSHMKIGFDMLSDIKAYQCTIPFLTEELQKTMTRVVCLKRLTNDLLDLDPTILHLSQSTSWKKRMEEGKNPIEDTQRAIKLSDLVEVVLNTHLDKSLQKSNWSLRPLRRDQLIYAATDANILIKLFIKFGELTKEKGYDYEERVRMIENDLNERKEDKTEKKKKAKMTEEDYALLVESVNAATLSANGHEGTPKSFITDSMFAGLGKHLRRLGVDVIFADSKEQLIRKGRENPSRIILSYGKNINEYKEMFNGRVLVVGNGMSAQDQVKRVVNEFKIKLSPVDVFTRCMLCNGDQFVMVPSIVLQALFARHNKIDEDYEDEIFDPVPFKEKIEKATPSHYGGFGCELEEYDKAEERFIVKCTNGVVDIYNILVIADANPNPVEVTWKKVTPEVVESERPFYYLCGKCGKVYWDGTHGKRYKSFADEVCAASSSDQSVIHE
ncbi:hypothetical protein PENTCL1PPCAC_6341, partial [Pristionchus entomophagus]